MIAHDRIRLIGSVYKMQKPTLLRGFLHDSIGDKNFESFTKRSGVFKKRVGLGLAARSALFLNTPLLLIYIISHVPPAHANSFFISDSSLSS